MGCEKKGGSDGRREREREGEGETGKDGKIPSSKTKNTGVDIVCARAHELRSRDEDNIEGKHFSHRTRYPRASYLPMTPLIHNLYVRTFREMPEPQERQGIRAHSFLPTAKKGPRSENHASLGMTLRVHPGILHQSEHSFKTIQNTSKQLTNQITHSKQSTNENTISKQSNNQRTPPKQSTSLNTPSKTSIRTPLQNNRRIRILLQSNQPIRKRRARHPFLCLPWCRCMHRLVMIVGSSRAIAAALARPRGPPTLELCFAGVGGQSSCDKVGPLHSPPRPMPCY